MTWLADFHEKTELNKYPIVLRTRGGIGYRTPQGTVSNFVGHPLHYKDGNEWRPITLAYDNGQWEGSNYGWNGYEVTYRKRALYRPESITFNGIIHPLNFFLDIYGHRLVAYVPNIGEYQILFTEKGVKEILTIPESLDGLLTFQVKHQKKPDKIYKYERHITGTELSGDTYQLTPDMTYPLAIDPDYADTTNDGYIYGSNATYSTSRSTSYAIDVTAATMNVGQYITGGEYRCERGYPKFDTSGIPDTDVISAVAMKLVCTVDSSQADFTVNINKYDWSASDPITSGNKETPYDGCLAATLDNTWRNTSGMSTNTVYTSNALDITWPSKTSYTYYGLISADDVANSPPGAPDAIIQIATQENSTSGYRPVLTVTHAAGGAAGPRKLALLGVG